MKVPQWRYSSFAKKRPRRPWRDYIPFLPLESSGMPQELDKVEKRVSLLSFPAATESQTQICGGKRKDVIIHLFTFGSQIVLGCNCHIPQAVLWNVAQSSLWWLQQLQLPVYIASSLPHPVECSVRGQGRHWPRSW